MAVINFKTLCCRHRQHQSVLKALTIIYNCHKMTMVHTWNSGWQKVGEAVKGLHQQQRISSIAKTPSICCFSAELHLSLFTRLFKGNITIPHRGKTCIKRKKLTMVLDFRFGRWKCPNQECGKGHQTQGPNSKPSNGRILISWNPIRYPFLCMKIKKFTIDNIFFS